MGFLSNLVSGAVKVAVSPIAILDDVAKVATGEKPKTTKKLLEKAGEDVIESLDDLSKGKVI